MKDLSLNNIQENLKPSHRMPLMFVGHGNPMNAILDNEFSRTWKSVGKTLPRPKAILSISAHWITRNSSRVTAMEKPETIHDFGGFPDELYAQQYPAPGSPNFAAATQQLVDHPKLALDYEWGLDHGTWSVLKPMFPLADIPVYQLSIDYEKPPRYHFDLGERLKPLRSRGVLVIGSGNLVHNLSAMRWKEPPYEWAIEFDRKIAGWIESGDRDAVVNFQKLGALASRAHPTIDHYLPLLYVMGMRDEEDNLEYFNDSFDLASVSMRSALFR